MITWPVGVPTPILHSGGQPLPQHQQPQLQPAQPTDADRTYHIGSIEHDVPLDDVELNGLGILEHGLAHSKLRAYHPQHAYVGTSADPLCGKSIYVSQMMFH